MRQEQACIILCTIHACFVLIYNLFMENSNNKKFKLVLGLGNNSLEQVYKLCGIYALVGADIFDLSPSLDSLKAAKNGISDVGLNPDDFKFCISLGLKGDKHIKKALIRESKCDKCYKCLEICPQDAIFRHGEYPKIDWAKCIGCKKCEKSCIEFTEIKTNIKKVVKDFKKEKIDMIELHISSNGQSEIIRNWKYILKHFDCQKSICIDRSKYGDEKLLKLIKRLIEMNPQRTIIQADGVAMSGASDISSTLQAIAHAQIYKDIEADIFISGGTNLFTKKLADSLNVRFDGITIGSFARNMLKNAIDDKEKSLEIAKEIVKSVKS